MSTTGHPQCCSPGKPQGLCGETNTVPIIPCILLNVSFCVLDFCWPTRVFWGGFAVHIEHPEIPSCNFSKYPWSIIYWLCHFAGICQQRNMWISPASMRIYSPENLQWNPSKNIWQCPWIKEVLVGLLDVPENGDTGYPSNDVFNENMML